MGGKSYFALSSNSAQLNKRFIYATEQAEDQSHNVTQHSDMQIQCSPVVCELDGILDESIRRELIHFGYILTKVFKGH